jgi:hypothetical protein
MIGRRRQNSLQSILQSKKRNQFLRKKFPCSRVMIILNIIMILI